MQQDGPPVEESCSALVGLGLTLIQAKTLLALGVQNYKSAGDISKLTKVARPQVYRALPELQRLGLIEEKIGIPNQYRAVNMREVIAILSNRKKTEINENIDKMSKLLDRNPYNFDYDALNDINGELKIITGLENVKKTYKKAFESSQKISFVTNFRPWTIQLSLRLNFNTFKLRKDVQMRVIVGALPSAPWPLKWRKKEFNNVEIKVLPFRMPMSVGIFDKKAFLTMYPKEEKFNLEELKVITCDYPSIVETLRIYFEPLWDSAKEEKPTDYA